MNIEFHISAELKGNILAMRMIDSLKKELADCGHTVDGTSPDICHLFGCWDGNITTKGNSLHRKRIPYIYSPMSGLQPWNISEHAIKSNLSMDKYRNVARNAMAVHACSIIEQQNLKQLKIETDCFVVNNPAVTQSITVGEMTRKLLTIYENSLLKHDEHVRNDIREKAEKAVSNIDANEMKRQKGVFLDILQQVYYCQYLFNRQHLQTRMLQQLAETMINADYNEDIMATVLHEQQLENFMSSLEAVMEGTTNLTEGFMPINSSDDRLAKQIRKGIIA